MAGCLVIRPRFDLVTSISFEWCGEVVGWLRDAGFGVIDLAEGDAVRGRVEAAVEEYDPSLVVFYDHGDENGLLQQGGRGYVVDKRNDHILSGREVFTLACSWGRDGGIHAWRKGAKAVWCYIDVFAFTSEALDEFRRFANSGLRFRLEGRSWKECLQLARQLAGELCRKLIEEGKYLSAVILQEDADALRCYTDETPPETSKCFARRLLIKLLGPERAWRIGGMYIAGLVLSLTGWGIAIHDFAHQVYELRGTILSLEGGYVGFAMILVGVVLLAVERIVLE